MKINNRGITLIELLAVLAIIAILALIVFPIVSSVIKDSTTESTDATKNSVKEAAEMYTTDRLETEEITIPSTVYLDSLVDGGYLTIDEEAYNLEESYVVIGKDGNQYTYTVTLVKN